MSDIPPIPSDKIGERAHKIWQARGCPPDTSDENWQYAQKELELERKFKLAALWFSCKRRLHWYKKDVPAVASGKDNHGKMITIGTISILGLATTFLTETIKHHASPLEQQKLALEISEHELKSISEHQRLEAEIQYKLNKEDITAPFMAAALYGEVDKVHKPFKEWANHLLKSKEIHLPGSLEYLDPATAEKCQQFGRAQINFAKRLCEESKKKGQRQKLGMAIEQGDLAVRVLAKGYGTNIGERDNQNVAEAKSLYAYILAESANKDDLEQAENYYKQAIAALNDSVGGLSLYKATRGDQLAEAMNGLASLYAQKNDLKKAADYYNQALEVARCKCDCSSQVIEQEHSNRKKEPESVLCRTICRNLIVNVYLEQQNQNLNALVNKLAELDEIAANVDKQEGKAIAKGDLAYGYFKLAQSLKSQEPKAFQENLAKSEQLYKEADKLYHGLDKSGNKVDDDLTDAKDYAELRKSLALINPKAGNESRTSDAFPETHQKVRKPAYYHRKSHSSN